MGLKMFKNILKKKPSIASDKVTYKAMTAPELIKYLRQENVIRSISSKVALSQKNFEQLYLAGINNFIELVQLMPASQNHHHAHDGGLIIHTLSVIEEAVHLRRQFTLPISGTPELIEEQKHLWTYAIFAGALLHDVGKVLTLVNFHLTDTENHQVYSHAMTSGTVYSLSFKATGDYASHSKIGLSFFSVLPEIGRNFLASDTRVYNEFVGYMLGEKSNWGSIGEILRRADMKSTSDALRRTNGERNSNIAGVVADNMGQRMMSNLRTTSQGKINLGQYGGQAELGHTVSLKL